MRQDAWVFPNIDPVLFSLGQYELFGMPFEPAIRWYALMYLMGLGVAFYLAYQVADKADSGWTRTQVSDLLFNGFMGVILGGRIGYVFFYQFDTFLQDPSYLFKMNQGGMSFHGGFLGVIVAMLYTAKLQKRTFWQVADFVSPLVPAGLGLGRLGNFINGELVGRPVVMDVPWGMIFPHVDQLVRHPSQLYQFLGEGVFLLTLLLWYRAKMQGRMIEGAMSGLFCIGYGTARCVVEFFREPDAHLGLYFDLFSQGQLLSLPMIAYGIYLMNRHRIKEVRV